MDLSIKPVPVPPNVHPPPPDPRLPQHEFTLAVVAPIGVGKTTVICNFIEWFKGYFHEIILITPTLLSDPKWVHIRNLPLRVENKELEEWKEKKRKKGPMEGMLFIDEDGRPMRKKRKVKKEPFDPKIPDECCHIDIDEQILREICEPKKELINELAEDGEPKHIAGRWLFVFDDQVGGPLMNNKKNNYMKEFYANIRHLCASAVIVSQNYNELIKTVRTNQMCWIFFKIPSMKEIEVIMTEQPCDMTHKQWLKAYKHATGRKFGFMYINYTLEQGMRVWKNFDSILSFSDD